MSDKLENARRQAYYRGYWKGFTHAMIGIATIGIIMSIFFR